MASTTVALPDEVREELRHRCRTDTYFLGKAVLGFKDLVVQPHLHMCEFMEGPARRKLALVPRGHLKTSLWTIADTVRRICADPNIRILIANEALPNAVRFLSKIKAIFMRNQLFQTIFPELIWPSFINRANNSTGPPRWSSTEIEIPRTEDYPEGTVEVMGVGGAVVSRHYKVIKLDDLIGKEASESPPLMRKTIDWYQYCESLLEDPENDEIAIYGTPWTHNDVYKWVDDNEPNVSRFFRSCYADERETQPLWPQRFTMKALDRLRKKYGTFKFSCQYKCRPFDPDKTNFREEWLRYFELRGEEVVRDGGQKTPVAALRRYMRYDPALGESEDAARNAIVVDGVSPDNDKYLLATWARRCQPLEAIESLFNLQKRWDCEAIGIESVAFQKFLRPFVEREADRQGIWLNVVPLPPDTRTSKASRIRSVQPYFERGEIFVQRHQEEFLEEFRTFPIGKTIDLMDAFAYGPKMWDVPESEEEAKWAQRGYWPGAEGRSEVTGY